MTLLLFFVVPVISSFLLLGFAESRNRLKTIAFIAASGIANIAAFYWFDQLGSLQIVLASFTIPFTVIIYALASPVGDGLSITNL